MPAYAQTLGDSPLDFLTTAVDTVNNYVKQAEGYVNKAGDIAKDPYAAAQGAVTQYTAGNQGQQSSAGQPVSVSAPPPSSNTPQPPPVSTNPAAPTPLPNGATAAIDTRTGSAYIQNPDGTKVEVNPAKGTVTKTETSDLSPGGFIKRNFRPAPVPLLVASGTAIATYSITKKPLRTLLFGLGALMVTNYVSDRAAAAQ